MKNLLRRWTLENHLPTSGYRFGSLRQKGNKKCAGGPGGDTGVFASVGEAAI